MFKKTLVCLTICIMVIAGLPLGAGAAPVITAAETTSAATALDPVGSNGSIDWDKRTIEAVGYGLPSSLSKSPAHAQLMARRAAIADAYRNLLEAIQGVKVDSETTVQNFETVNDTVKVKISGLVSGARIVTEQPLADGSYQVTMSVNLYGRSSLSEIIADTTKSAGQQPLPDPSLAYIPKALPAYTGLVIDTTGLPLVRAMSPVIYDETGRPIYGHTNLIPDYVVSKGMVDYMCTPEDLRDLDLGQSRAGINPISVKAIGLRDHNVNIVISQADADLILAANAQANFLPKATVCVKQN
ncbi:MAG: hypothetical protein H6Q72_791 [Firmicutes bacterium]|nr:hypothetical protein [Bacillota bacterium]